MSHKEMTAGVQLAGQVLVAAWLFWDLLAGGLAGATVTGVAIKLLWVIGAVIVFTIVATIVMTIVFSIARGEAFEDEPADERDLLIEAKSQKWSSYVTSSLAALALVPLALGADPVLAAYALFGAPMIGGTIHAIYQLYYYRVS
ncbi:MAG TPA: hypothetical protein VGN60_09420 [Devosia sp.]|nr:hypothetical protein [Devosia sp.]